MTCLYTKSTELMRSAGKTAKFHSFIHFDFLPSNGNSIQTVLCDLNPILVYSLFLHRSAKRTRYVRKKVQYLFGTQNRKCIQE